MDDDVIARVESFGMNEGQPEMPRGQPIFEWDIGVPIDGDDETPIDDDDGDNNLQDENAVQELEYDNFYEDEIGK